MVDVTTAEKYAFFEEVGKARFISCVVELRN